MASGAPAAAAEEVLYAAPGAALEVSAEAGAVAVEAAVDGGALVALPGPPPGRLTAPGEEGRHWLSLASRDAVGRASEVRWVRLVVDGSPPALDVTTEPPAVEVGGALWTGAAARVVARATDEVSGVARVGLSCAGREATAEGAEAGCSLAGAAGGRAEIAAWAEDVAGNRAETTAVWRLDAVPPRVALVVEGERVAGAVGPVLAPSARLATPAEDADSGVGGFELRLDGRAVDGFDDLTTGVHRAEVVALDRAGNRSPPAVLDFAYDDRPPLLAAEVVPGGEAGGVLLRLTARDEPAGLASLTWSAPGQPWQALASTAVAAGAPPADFTLDAAGARVAVRTEVPLPLAADGGVLRLAALDRVGNQAEIEVALPGGEGR